MSLPLDTITMPTPLENLSVAQVTELQAALKSLGYGLDADGILGPLTKGVWATFKADNKLDLPDEIGPASVGLLRQRTASGSSSGVPLQAVNIVKTFEGLVLKAYDDGTGVWTIGYGTTTYPDGRAVRDGDTITDVQAAQYLAHDMEGTVATLAATVPFWHAMNSNQQSALISFGYNLGGGFFGAAGFATISAALRDHRWSDVPSILPMYSDPGDPTVHAGLLRRRIAEATLWQGQGPFASAA